MDSRPTVSPPLPASYPDEVTTRRVGALDLRFLAIALGVVVVYFVTAKLGLRLAVVAEQVTAVWPPTGIALAAVLLLGGHITPAIWLGAFLVNVTVNEPLATAAGIATGNTLEALVGAWLLRRVVGIGQSVDQLRDAIGLIVFGALASPTVSATIGVVSLVLGGVQPWSSFWTIWVVWWLGDAMGALVVAPVLLAWVGAWRKRWLAPRLAEAAAGVAGLAFVGLLVFTGVFGRAASNHPLEYTIFPFLIWFALRFGRLGATTVTAVGSVIAVWGTAHSYGPFATPDRNESLILLQVFLGIVAMSGLVLAAAIHERNVADRRRAADYAVTHALADSANLGEAAPRILQAVGESLDWPFGALWTVDPDIGAVRCAVVWVAEGRAFPEFEVATRQRTFRPGIGLPGRVWEGGRAVWVADVVPDATFPRASIAGREGLHGAFAVPIVLGGRPWGVVEFFSREIERPDVDLLEMMTVVGSQIGQFIERKQVEVERAALLMREQSARAEAEAASRAKDEFLAMLGHELRNPLGAISSAIGVLERVPANGPEAQRAQAIIGRQTGHLARLVNDLLDVARVTSGKIPLRCQPLDLKEVVERCLTALQHAGRTGQHRIGLVGDGGLVNGDPTRLEQVVGNLLDNALKYTPPGGRVDVTVTRERDEAVLRVRDSGIGIPPEALPGVFELFVQGAQSLDRTQGGLGMGLTLAKRLVELHGGRIAVASEGQDRGSEFTVCLPLARVSPDAVQSGAIPSQGPPRRILVVEDHADARDSLCLWLRQWGHEVDEADNGVRGLERILATNPEVALVDIGLPGRDGYDLARTVRGAPGGAQICLIALTGYGQAEDRRRAEEAGFDRHLVKPVDERQLHAVLASLPRRL
jgi:signal transduction histidine kinase/integral membrane sensor domain MASE1